MSESGIPIERAAAVESEQGPPAAPHGPQHGTAASQHHGVLRLLLELDGETIMKCRPSWATAHRHREGIRGQKLPAGRDSDGPRGLPGAAFEQSGLLPGGGEAAGPGDPAARAVDAGDAHELTRLNSHLVWLGTHALDIGAMTRVPVLLPRGEDILRIFEMFSGQRMMTSYFRIGGLALEPPRAGMRG